jgi:hypothetical protein
VNAVTKALRDLPCVDKDSVSVNFDAKEAYFTLLKGSTCKVQDVKQAVADTGRATVAAVKSSPAK